ncbi:hypothetical protein C7B80_11890 [Cyanosarcina cf. burmensis CCALA 770]|nr:hypothetical protein C7B80_11890 [Cyanosarcina cf. burmensis CCALA 770]
MTQTQQSVKRSYPEGNRILPSLTAPEVLALKLVGHRYFVELVSKQVHLQDDRAVPVRTQIIDVVVVEPTLQTVEQLLTATGWLKDWQIVSYSTPVAMDAPF